MENAKSQSVMPKGDKRYLHSRLVFFMSLMDYALYALEIVYFPLILIFTTLLLPRTRRSLRKSQWYENKLNLLVLIRQILLFLFPLSIATVISPVWSLNQLPTLVALGLSIIVFWVVELPLLTKANILITFGVDDGNAIREEDYRNEIVLDVDRENVVNTRVHNLGFSTLKSALIEIYFGDGFEVVPCGDERYKGLDFFKSFSIQKTHCGVVFTPKDNFQTIPPQEMLIFQTVLRKPKNMQTSEVIIQFSSENSWGMRKVKVPIRVVKR